LRFSAPLVWHSTVHRSFQNRDVGEQKLKTPLANPLIIAMLLVVGFLSASVSLLKYMRKALPSFSCSLPLSLQCWP
jgi:putative effector of murein hydrolase